MTSRNRATASVLDAAAKTLCDGSTNFSKAGYVYVVDADLKGYFDTIPHDRS